MISQPASNGSANAAYLWKEAVTVAVEEAERLARGVEVPEGVEDRLAGFEEELVERLDGLRLAFAAVNEIQYIEALDRLRNTVDSAEFDSLAESLKLACEAVGQSEYVRAVEDLIAIRQDIEIERQGLKDYQDARNGVMLNDFGVEYRRDTSKELAALLGFAKDAVPRLKDLKNLLSAKTAHGSRIPGRNYKSERPDQVPMGSFDLIFSADKSVSVIEALAPVAERRAIRLAHKYAVDAAMRVIAGRLGVARNRRGGQDLREPADVTWVMWHHRFTRRGDPSLHTHVSLLNVALGRESGRVTAVDTKLFHGFQPIVREVYHRELARNLATFGMNVEYDAKRKAAVLTDVPEWLLKHFSRRTDDIFAYLQKNGVDTAALTPKGLNWAMQRAAAATIVPKRLWTVPGKGHEAWHARATGAGYVPPPHYVDPVALQRAGLVHTQLIDQPAFSSYQPSQQQRQPGQQTPQSQQPQPQQPRYRARFEPWMADGVTQRAQKGRNGRKSGARLSDRVDDNRSRGGATWEWDDYHGIKL
jgi:conjugative relaxase-like TrwC/TraI family protein